MTDENTVPLRDHLDALEHARERAQDMAAAEREKSASILRTPADTTDVSLRSYLEALRTGDQRALDMASEERAKAAEVLRDEQRRALTIAQDEREKAARALSAGTDRAIADNFARLSDRFAAYEQHIREIFEEKERAARLAADERERAADALRTGLDRAIREGDDRLREHISNQVQQIKASQESANRLELERVGRSHDELTAKIDGSTALFNATHAASEKAVDKAEIAQKSINSVNNEFRQSLSDLGTLMMPRKEAEANKAEQDRVNTELRAQLADLSQRIAVGPATLPDLQSYVDRAQGGQAQVQDSRAVQNTNIAASSLAQQIKDTRAGIYLALLSAVILIVGLILAHPSLK